MEALVSFRSLFVRRKPSAHRQRPLGVDFLEQRTLLSVSPGGDTSALVGSQLPAVAVANFRLDNSQPIAAHAHDVVLNQMTAFPLFGHGIVDHIDVASAPGSTLLRYGTDRLMLRGDLNHNPNDGYEVFLGYATYKGGDLATFEHLSQPVFIGLGNSVKLQVSADIAQEVAGGNQLGIKTDVSFVNAFGTPLAANRVLQVGQPTLFTVDPTVVFGDLYVVERSQPETDTAVSYETVNLLRYEVYSSQTDLVLTKQSFVAQQGNLLNAFDYTLWTDTDHNGTVDTVVGSGATVQNGRVTFDDGFVVQAGVAQVFEVHARAAASFANPAQLQLNFAAVDSVLAETVYGGTSVPANHVHVDRSAESTVFVLKEQGDLYVQKSANPVPSRDLLGGTLGDEVLRLTLHAEYEPTEVTRLSFSLSNSGALRDVDSLELYKPGSTTPFAVATISQTIDGIGHFTTRMNNKQLVIGEGEDQDILIRPRMKSDEQGSVGGDTFSVSVARVEARGYLSSNTLPQNDGDTVAEGEVIVGRSTAGPNQPINSSVHSVVLSKIVSVTNANPDPNGSAIPVGSAQPIGQFKLTAAAHTNTRNGSNDVMIDELSFVVNATNVLLDTQSFAVYDKAGNILKQNGARFETLDGQPIVGQTITGTFRVVFDQILARGVINSSIDAGTDKTFVVQTTVLNPKIANTNSTLQVSLETDRIVWFDMDTLLQIEHGGIKYPDPIVHSTLYQI